MMNTFAQSLRRWTVVSLLALLAPPVFAQPEFVLQQLPEPAGTTASEPLAMAITDFNFETPKLDLAGRVRDESGVWHAVVWSQQGDGPWTIELLPVADPTAPSVAHDIHCDASGVCYTVGSIGNPGSEQFTIWKNSGGGWGVESLAAP